MRKTTVILCIAAIAATVLFTKTAAFAGPKRWYANNIQPGGIVSLIILPAGKKFVLGSVIFNNPDISNPAGGALYIGTSPMVEITIPKSGHFEHAFSNVVLLPGDELSIWNTGTVPIGCMVTGMVKKK